MRSRARVTDQLGRRAHRRALALETARRDSRQLSLPLGIPVPSASHKGEHYVVEVVNGIARCTCLGFVHHGHCHHAASADVEAIFGRAE